MGLNIVIPLGGVGRRFRDEGYIQPKPLVRVCGKYILSWVLDSLSVEAGDELYVPYNPELDMHGFREIVSNMYPDAHLIKLDMQTNGAAHTLYECMRRIPESRRGNRTVCLDGDTFYNVDILSKVRQSQDACGVAIFTPQTEDPIYSYVTLDDCGRVSSIREKVKISDSACSGCYYFESSTIVESAYTDLASRPASGEIYTSAVVGWLLESGLNVGVTHLQISDIHVLGTPIQVKIFAQQAGAKSSEPMRVCFDIDETLLHRPQGAGYEASVPIEDNVALARYLKSLGHTIVLYTARRMRTHQGNVGSVIADIGKLTVDSLDRYEIPYDEIYFGKPYAHVYIDDLAVSAYSDLEKELGFYDGFVGEREFNQIESVKVDVLRKSSENASILGEMYYYENIPKSVSDLFPRYFGSDGSRAYLVEKLDGMSVSHLFVKEALTVSDLGLLLRDIRRIHESQDMELADSSLDIYANYRDKVVSRYTESVYGPLGDSASTLYSDLLARLGDYHDRDRGVWGVIHGDPVFTNILRCANARYKFIDMRGQLGETLTIWGDRMYDYAKIYQSLIGYDEILLGRSVGDGYRRRLLDVFEDHIHNALPEGALSEVQTLTASLLFSLIPLHIESRRPHFLRLACECAGSNS